MVLIGAEDRRIRLAKEPIVGDERAREAQHDQAGKHRQPLAALVREKGEHQDHREGDLGQLAEGVQEENRLAQQEKPRPVRLSQEPAARDLPL